MKRTEQRPDLTTLKQGQAYCGVTIVSAPPPPRMESLGAVTGKRTSSAKQKSSAVVPEAHFGLEKDVQQRVDGRLVPGPGQQQTQCHLTPCALTNCGYC